MEHFNERVEACELQTNNDNPADIKPSDEALEQDSHELEWPLEAQDDAAQQNSLKKNEKAEKKPENFIDDEPLKESPEMPQAPTQEGEASPERVPSAAEMKEPGNTTLEDLDKSPLEFSDASAKSHPEFFENDSSPEPLAEAPADVGNISTNEEENEVSPNEDYSEKFFNWWGPQPDKAQENAAQPSSYQDVEEPHRAYSFNENAPEVQADIDSERPAEPDVSSQTKGSNEVTPYDNLMSYMSDHHYGPQHYSEYSKDPEWQRLDNDFRTQQGLEPIDYGTSDWKDTHVDDFRDYLVAQGFPEDSPELGAILANEQSGIDDICNNSDATNEIKDPVGAIEKMDYNNLSEDDKNLISDTVQDHLKDKYGDLVDSDRFELVPEKINIADTDTCRNVYESDGHPYGDETLGFYDPTTDDIYIDAPRNGECGGMTEIAASADHEALHLLSDGGLREGWARPGDNYDIGENLNEGVTEMYASRDMDDMGFNYNSSSYQPQVEVASALEDAVGSDTMRDAYFTHSPDLIRNEFDKAYAPRDEDSNPFFDEAPPSGQYEKFLGTFNDYINASPDDPSYSTKKQAVFEMIDDLKTRREDMP